MLSRIGTVLVSTVRAAIKQPPPAPALRSKLHTASITPETACTFVARLCSKAASHASAAARDLGRSAYVRGQIANYSSISRSQNLSLPARVALSKAGPRAFGAPYLPRGPTIPRPNAVTNVGLGTARNFSSGRPLFQNLIQNVPVAARSFCELDLDPRLAHLRAGLRAQHNFQDETPAALGSYKSKSRPQNSIYDDSFSFEVTPAQGSISGVPSKSPSSGPAVTSGGVDSLDAIVAGCNQLYSGPDADDLEHFFGPPATIGFSPAASHAHAHDMDPGQRPSAHAISGDSDTPNDPFTTMLSIPLAPPMTQSGMARAPLPHATSLSASGHSGLLFDRNEALSSSTAFLFPSVHDAYTAHAAHVTALFAALDAADVWARGASCEAFGVVSNAFSSSSNAEDMWNSQHGGEARVLRIKFAGWSEDRVRAVLQVDALEWCEMWSEPLAEVEGQSENEDAYAYASTEMSFVMPTLDFSFSFGSATAAAAEVGARAGASTRHDETHLYDSAFSSYASTDVEEYEPHESDFEGESEDGTDSESWFPASRNGRGSRHMDIAFSSSFIGRMPQDVRA